VNEIESEGNNPIKNISIAKIIAIKKDISCVIIFT
jgi:hypothetical protein